MLIAAAALTAMQDGGRLCCPLGAAVEDNRHRARTGVTLCKAHTNGSSAMAQAEEVTPLPHTGCRTHIFSMKLG